MQRTLVAALATLASTAALAGGDCGGDCYRRAWQPAEYGTLVETYPVRPRTYAVVTPPAYRTVTERVVVRPAGRIWQESRDASGHRVGCWVDVPAETRLVTRRVMVAPGSVEPYASAGYSGVRAVTYQTQRAGWGWEPLGGR